VTAMPPGAGFKLFELLENPSNVLSFDAYTGVIDR
jgi:hypothetical protein